jgi:hypothetical protein
VIAGLFLHYRDEIEPRTGELVIGEALLRAAHLFLGRQAAGSKHRQASQQHRVP